jgi:hypothetical protein
MEGIFLHSLRDNMGSKCLYNLCGVKPSLLRVESPIPDTKFLSLTFDREREFCIGNNPGTHFGYPQNRHGYCG